MKQGRIHIGTSGWYYKHWVGTFYPEGIQNNQQLSYYVKYFTTVELNNSFYRLPYPNTFNEWAKTVPADFIFSIKANRYITHMKKLKVEKEDLTDFFVAVQQLGKKLGVILFQLPPHWKVNTQRLDDFLTLLPSGYRYTVEFRNPSWYIPEVYRILIEHNIAFCHYELAGHQSPQKITTDFVYVRLHGPGEKYQGSYSKELLQEHAKKWNEWQKEGKDVYVYFDNDQEGYAAFNARQLIELL